MANGYEMRADLLALATQYLTNKYQSEFAIHSQTGNYLAMQAMSYPTTADIIELASHYQRFVDNH